MASKNFKGAKFNPNNYNGDSTSNNLNLSTSYGFDVSKYELPSTTNQALPKAPSVNGLEEYKAKMNKQRGDKLPSVVKGIYDKVLDPVAYAIDKTLYGNPLTQRTMIKAGETVAGPGAMKDYDGTTLQPKDAGAVGNFVADSAGTLLGMRALPLGNENLLGLTDKAGVNASEFIAKKLPSGLPNLPSKVLPSMVRGAVDNGLGAMMTSDDKSIQGTLKTGASNALGGALLFGGGKALGEGLSKLKGFEKAPIELPTIKPIETKVKQIEPLLPIKKDIPTIKNEVAATSNAIIDNNGIQRSTQKVVSSSKDKSSFNEKLNAFYTRTVDSNNPLKPIDDKTYTLATNSKNVGGTIDYIFKDGLVDKTGKKIGASLKELVEEVPKGSEKDFWEYALQRHNIARATEGKNVYKDFTPEQSLEAVKKWESIHPEWKAKADNFTNWINSFMNEWGVKSGLTDGELYKSLTEKYPNYLPTQRDFTDIESGVSFINGKGFVDQKTPLKKATGSERDIIDPVENIMELVNRTVRTAKYNEVGQSLVEAIQRDPNKMMKFAQIIDESEVNPNLNNIVSILQGGKPTYLMINDKSLLKSLEGLYKTSPGDIEKAAKKVTGIFKSLVTQKNPVFAVRNIMRDVPTAYIYGNEANPIKFGADLFKAGKDLLTNSEVAQQYKALGGGGSNFFNSGDVAKSAKELTRRTPLQKIGDVIETINNTTESAPRLAEFKRTLNKTGDPQKALFDAADVTTNFSRGGDIVKTLDSYVPYMNAGFQGLDKLGRQLKNKPLQTIGKATVAITAPTVALNLINKDNPDYQALDNRTKDNYFLIPKDDGTFIKIPKSRELGALFSSLFERIERQSKGDKNAFKGFKNTLATSFAPANPIENNILSPYFGLKANKDFAGRTIVPMSMEDLSPKYQYDEKTSEIAKKLGEVANISPKEIDYLIKSYTGVIGQLGLPMTTKSNYNDNTTKNLLKPITTQFKADPLYSNQSLTDFYDNYDMLQTKAADKNFSEKIPSKTVTREEELKNKFAKASKEITDLNKKIKDYEGNEDMVRALRLQMIRKAQETNRLIN